MGDLVSNSRAGTLRALRGTRTAGSLRTETVPGVREAVAPISQTCIGTAENPLKGDEELSARKGSETERAAQSRHSKKPASSGRSGSQQGRAGSGKHRSGEIGRALRSAYDDTLRETVPDEFINLLGKLS